MPRPKSRTSDDDWLAVGTEMAFLLGVSFKTLQLWQREEALPKGPDNKYRVRTVISWALARVQGEVPDDLAPTSLKSSTEARTLYYREQTRKLQIENEKSLRNLIDLEEALQLYQTLAQAVVDTMEGLPSMVDVDPETRRRLEQAVSKARLDLIDRLEKEMGGLAGDAGDTGPAAEQECG